MPVHLRQTAKRQQGFHLPAVDSIRELLAREPSLSAHDMVHRLEQTARDLEGKEDDIEGDGQVRLGLPRTTMARPKKRGKRTR